MPPNISFRPCSPDHAKCAVPLIVSSGPHTFDYIFAQQSLEQTINFVERAYINGRMELGYQTHTAMISNNQVVGVGGLWNSKKNIPFMLAGLRQIMLFYDIRDGIQVIKRALQMETVVKPPAKGVAYIGHIGIAPIHRGKGFGTLLISNLIEQARLQGFTVCALDVSIRNPKAQKLYEHLGFKVKSINPANYKRKFGDLVEHRYMEMNI